MPKLFKISFEDYDHVKPNMIMGTRAGLTEEFNISVKLRSKDPLRLNSNWIFLSKRVNAWITEDPIKIWELVNGTPPSDISIFHWRKTHL